MSIIDEMDFSFEEEEFELNNFIEENKLLEIIKEIHDKLSIKDKNLIQKIEKCVNHLGLDMIHVKNISNLFAQSNSYDKISLLENFYDFLLAPEFSNRQINKIIPKIISRYQEKNIYMNMNLKNILIKIKIDLVLETFEIEDRYIEELITRCIQQDWNLSNISEFLRIFKKFLPINEKNIDKKLEEEIKLQNLEKNLIFESILNIISAFPINNKILDLRTIDFFNTENVARNLYLLFSNISELNQNYFDTEEIMEKFENENLYLYYFTKEKIEQFKMQMHKVKSTKKPNDYKEWIKHFKNYDFNSKEKNDYISEAIGVISHALEKTKKFKLRDTQILALLIFIDNNENQNDNENNKEEQINNNNKKRNKIKIEDKTKGIIEEILPGEGKSIIISCLSIYYGLRNHKVDIITFRKSLAIRDSFAFKELYKIFGLTTDYVQEFQSNPYKADILYGTFEDFEGDLLYEMSYFKKTRGDRPFDIIIIDDVDIAFIDHLADSTHLSLSRKEYQLLTPIFSFIYLIVVFISNVIFNEFKKKFSYNSKVNEYDEICKLMNIAKNIFEDMKYGNIKTNFKGDEAIKEKDKNINIYNWLKLKLEEINKSLFEYIKNGLYLPKFLKDYVEMSIYDWIINSLSLYNLRNCTDYTIGHKNGNEMIIPIDISTGDLKYNSVYRNGLHQMLQIKENLELNPFILSFASISNITYFKKFKKKNFFGLTGTIGGRETFPIYSSDFFNSHLIFIPLRTFNQFIQLPPIRCYKEFYIERICEEILFHFSKGRKILIICKDINEALNIDNYLHREEFISKKPTIVSNIFLFLRDDIDHIEIDYMKTKKKIIITTNLGVRGAQIITDYEIERNGGLHIIITEIPNISRNEKQAFGRIYSGKRGSGQFVHILTEKEKFKTYEDLMKERKKCKRKRKNR